MPKTITIRAIEDGYGAALVRAFEGPVHEQAIFEPFALPLMVDGLLDEMGIEDPLRKMLHKGIVRQALFVGPGEGGWIITIGTILDAYHKVWGEVTAQSGITMFIELENHGFRWDDYRDSVLCLRLIKEAIEKEPRLRDDKDLRQIVNLNRPLDSAEDDSDPVFFMRTFSVFLHHVARCAGWTCGGKKKNRRSTPLSRPWVPAVAILHGLRNMNTVNCGKCQELHFTDTWKKVMCGHSMGLTWPSVLWIMQRPAGGKSIVNFLHWANSKGFSQELLVQIQRLPEDAWEGMSIPDLVDVVCTWDQMKRPGTLKGFLEIGGTRQSYEARQQAQEETLRTRALVQTAERDERLAASAPKGRNRGQRNAPKAEPAAVDFSAMCAQLEVTTHFSDVDQDTTRVILIHGLLREGKRLASMAALPERDEKKLWKQCREHLGQSVTKRMFNSILKALVAGHLVSASGGKYQLARKKPRWAEAYALLTQLQGLVSGHRS